MKFLINIFKKENRALKEIIKYKLIISFIIIFSTEIILSIAVDDSIFWMYKRLSHWLLISTILIFSVISFINLFINRLSVSLFITTLIATSMIYSHILKSAMRFTPIQFWDYKLIEEGLYALTMIINKPIYIILILFSLILLIAFLIKLLKSDKLRISIKNRFFMFFISTTSIVIIFSFISISYSNLFFMHRTNSCYIAKSGIYSFLILSAKHTNKKIIPKDYNESNIKEIVKKYSNAYDNKYFTIQENENPNIIFLSIESFFDPADIGIKFKKDPIPFFHSLQKEFGKKNFISPTYGGGTDRPEFEILTGFSKQIIREPVANYFIIKQPFFPNLASMLNILNYKTVGIEASKGKNFQKNIAYPKLGFDKLIAIADDFPNRELTWDKTSDNYIVNKTIQNIKKYSKLFLYIQTNATHARYNNVEINPNFEVLNENLEEDTKIIMQKYAQAIHVTDIALKKLVTYLKNSDKKSILFINGDHKPGKLGSSYKELKTFSGSNKKQLFNRYQTPLVIWHNLKQIKTPETISSNILSSILLNYISIDKKNIPIQFKITKLFLDDLPVVSKFYMDKNNKFYTKRSLPTEKEKMINDYYLLQYDILEGKQYSIKKNDSIN